MEVVADDRQDVDLGDALDQREGGGDGAIGFEGGGPFEFEPDGAVDEACGLGGACDGTCDESAGLEGMFGELLAEPSGLAFAARDEATGPVVGRVALGLGFAVADDPEMHEGAYAAVGAVNGTR